MSNPSHPLDGTARPGDASPAPADAIGEDVAALLAEPLAQALARPDIDAMPALRQRLAERVAASRRLEAPMFTTRLRHAPAMQHTPGARTRLLYQARRAEANEAAAALRPGEPLRALLIELAPGAHLDLPHLPGAHGLPARREWLVLAGTATVDGLELGPRDYHVAGHAPGKPPARQDTTRVSASAGGPARVFLRESEEGRPQATEPVTIRDASAGWPEFAPGIRRRVLWQHEGLAAMLYLAEAGASVPMHAHGHDEECLMVEGEVFLDDLLLQAGDYQLAPAGTSHRVTETDTGAVIYAHGDLDLRFLPG